jgi:hypothetical protein
MVERPVTRLKSKKPSGPGRAENEGIQRIPSRTSGTGWPHPSLDGEVDPALRDHDEHNQTDILTSGSNLAPAFPIPLCETSGCGSL